jgi:gas vesicle protein
MKNPLKALLTLSAGYAAGLLLAKKTGKTLRKELANSENPARTMFEAMKDADMQAFSDFKDWLNNSEKLQELVKTGKEKFAEIAKEAKEMGEEAIQKTTKELERVAKDATKVAADLKKKAVKKSKTVKKDVQKKATKFKNELKKKTKTIAKKVKK